MKDIDRGVGEGLRKNKVFPNSDSDAITKLTLFVDSFHTWGRVKKKQRI